MRREWLVRALRTFVQAALGFAAANAAGVVGEGTAIKDALAALTVASVAAGLAALMNIHKLGSGTPTATASAEGETDAAGLADEPDAADEAYAAAFDLTRSNGSGYAGSQYRADTPADADAKGGGDGE